MAASISSASCQTGDRFQQHRRLLHRQFDLLQVPMAFSDCCTERVCQGYPILSVFHRNDLPPPGGDIADLFEIFLVLNGLGFPGGDDLIQQSGHALVEGRVIQVFADDHAADIVLDGFGDGGSVAFQPAEL